MTGRKVRAVRRLCLVVDVEAYSRHDNPTQVDLQERLRAVVRHALATAGVPRWRTERQDRGDGELIILPAGVDEARSVPGLLGGLLVALDADRQAPRLRLRAALSQGVVHLAATGYVGKAVIDACRLIDAPQTRAELRDVPDADLCLVVTDDLYRDVLLQGYGGFPADGYRVIDVRDTAKGFATTAWMRALNVAALPPDAAAVAAVAALPFAAVGAVAFTQSLDELTAEGDDPADASEHDDPHLDDIDLDPVDHDDEIVHDDWV